MTTALDMFIESQLAFAAYATLAIGTPSVAALTDGKKWGQVLQSNISVIKLLAWQGHWRKNIP